MRTSLTQDSSSVYSQLHCFISNQQTPQVIESIIIERLPSRQDPGLMALLCTAELHFRHRQLPLHTQTHLHFLLHFRHLGLLLQQKYKDQHLHLHVSSRIGPTILNGHYQATVIRPARTHAAILDPQTFKLLLHLAHLCPHLQQ